jgi:DNA-binding LacI/PurR family transcriptional regulator
MNRPQGLMEELRAQIESGALQPGDRLPSYAEMKARHGLAPQTTDRIYSTLERAGLIVRAQGSGTFVAEQMPKDTAAPGSDNPLIALVVPAVESVFFSEILSGAETACWDAGFHLLIANTRGSSHREAQYLTSLAQRVAGLCIVPSESASYAAFNALLENEVPFVFVDRALDKLNASLAAADNELLGYMATKHLLELGHREVFVLCEGVASSVAERLRGYKRALDEAGVAFDPRLVRSNAQYMEAAGYSLTQEIVKAAARKRRWPCFASTT